MGRIVSLRGNPSRLEAMLEEFQGPPWDDHPPALLLRSVLQEFQDPIPELARLAVSAADEGVRESAVMMFASAAFDSAVPERLQATFADAAVSQWTRALRGDGLSERLRVLLLPLYAHYGGELAPEDFAFLRSTGERRVREAIESLQGTGLGGVDAALSSMGVLVDAPDDDSPLEVERALAGVDIAGRVLAAGAAEGALFAAVAVEGALGAGVDAATLLPVLGRIAGSESPAAAAWYLGELGRWPGGGEVHEAAARLAARIVEGGVVPRSLHPMEFRRARASAVDGAGSRSLIVVGRDASGVEYGASLLLNASRGVLDAVLHGEDVDSVESMLEGTGLLSAPVDLPLARSLVGDALLRHRGVGGPPPAAFLLCRHLLGEEPLDERPHVPDPRLPGDAPGAATTASVRGTGALAEMDSFDGFWFASDAVYAFVREERARTGLGPARRLRVTDALLRRFHRDVLPGERAGLLLLLDHTLEIEALAGRGAARPARLAAAVRRALAQPGFAMEEIPYVAVLARRALAVVDQNLRDGFASQDEANRAGLLEDLTGPDALMDDLDLGDGEWAFGR